MSATTKPAVLYLGPARPDFEAFLALHACHLTRIEAPVRADDFESVDWTVSYGYRHLVPWDVFRFHAGTIVNLHIGLLPWNRGADPVFWSVFDDTPSGVTIHEMVEELDAGPIIAQRTVERRDDDTFRTLYERHTQTVEGLFRDVWPHLIAGTYGSYHRIGDKVPYVNALPQSWDTPIAPLVGHARIVNRIARLRATNRAHWQALGAVHGSGPDRTLAAIQASVGRTDVKPILMAIAETDHQIAEALLELAGE